MFHELFDLLKNSDGPLNENDLGYVKGAIKEDPELLGMVSSRNASGDCEASIYHLCTLLHHAAAGPAHDIDLDDSVGGAYDAAKTGIFSKR